MRIVAKDSPLIEITRKAGSALLSLLYPPHCANCQRDTLPGVHVCGECARTAHRIRDPFCEKCSQPFDGAIESGFTCSNCLDRDFQFECAVAPFSSRGVVREYVHRLKYNKHMHLRHQLADWMVLGFEDRRLMRAQIDALVPVPLHSAREREREFNQARVLAELVSRRVNLPMEDCLRRSRYTTSQTRLDREERMENLRGAFHVAHTPRVTGRHLILIDDIFTTGSTVDECARVLRAAGAASVRVLTVARA
jgi:ComF family protein